MNLDNIFLAIDKEIHIDELILWLQDRKEKYLKLVPRKKENETIIELVMKETLKDFTPEQKKAFIDKIKAEKIKEAQDNKIVTK